MNKHKVFRIVTVTALVLSAFFVPRNSQASLVLPRTSCDSAQGSAHLVANMPQEDGTKMFQYGLDNNHFASRNGTVVTLNVNLLFTRTPATNIKIDFMDSSCSVKIGRASCRERVLAGV